MSYSNDETDEHEEYREPHEEYEEESEEEYAIEEYSSPEPTQIPPLRAPPSGFENLEVQTTLISPESFLTVQQLRTIEAENRWREENRERLERQRAEENRRIVTELTSRRGPGDSLRNRIFNRIRPDYRAPALDSQASGRLFSMILSRQSSLLRVRPHPTVTPVPVTVVQPTPSPPRFTVPPTRIVEEPAIVDDRIVGNPINLEGFNHVFQQLNQPHDQVNFGLEGTLRGVHQPVVQNAFVPPRNMSFTVDVDALYLLSYELPVPHQQPISLFILSNLILSISKNKQMYFEGQSIHKVPNIHLANFGYTGRFKINMFFPRLGVHSHLMPQDAQDIFVDHVLLPALRQIVHISYSTNIPSSIEVEKRRATRRAGRYTFEPTYFYQLPEQATLATAMRQIINNHPNLQSFQDFFFCTYTYGNKFPLQQNHFDQQIRQHFDDLDFGLFDIDNVLIDIGLQISHPSTTILWMLDQQSSPVLPLFFTTLNRSYKYLRLDSFANNANLGGCSYTTHKVEGDGRYRLMKFQCYHTIKSLSYLRTESGYRHNAFDLEPRDFLQDSTKVERTFNMMMNTFEQARQRTFPARAEFTLSYTNGLRLLDNIEGEVNQILASEPPVMSVIDTDVVVDYLINMVRTYQAFYQSHSNQVDIIHQQESLSSLAVIAYIYSGLLSRPYDWSTWRSISRYLNRNRSSRSQMLQLIHGSLVFDNRSRRWLVRERFNLDELHAIFAKSIAFINNGNRTTRITDNVRRTRSVSPVETERRRVMRQNLLNRPAPVEVPQDDVAILPFTVLRDPSHPYLESLYLTDPEATRITLKYATTVYESSRAPFRAYINMLQTHGNDVRVVDAMIEGLIYQLFNNAEAVVPEQYFNSGFRSTDMSLNVLQNEQAFFTFFNRDLVDFRHIFSLNSLHIFFPNPVTGDIRNMFSANTRKQRAIRLTDAREAYMYWQANLLEAERTVEAEQLQVLFFQRFLGLVRFIPAMRSDRQSLRYDFKNHRPVLFFYRNPHYQQE
ncbi:hypothetical protein BD560DRAFT_442135 [Blakeslea trispora]|nr:hypothetical protein BD560DRAFT_442135 [Blakeslea trispora]